MDTDFAGFQIDGLIDAFHYANLQVNNSILAERVDHGARPGIERNQSITGGDVQHTLVTSSVGPVRHATSRELPRGVRGSLAFAEAVRPDQLTGFPIERNNRSPRAAGGVQDTLDHERRSLQFVFGKRTQVVGLEAPGHLKLVKV